ncbi:MAG: hypothetical protein OQK04_01140, partial [Kangiellaceae bacterium]|nr:hypothetical protein [Kangiellaceae bacterium]
MMATKLIQMYNNCRKHNIPWVCALSILLISFSPKAKEFAEESKTELELLRELIQLEQEEQPTLEQEPQALLVSETEPELAINEDKRLVEQLHNFEESNDSFQENSEHQELETQELNDVQEPSSSLRQDEPYRTEEEEDVENEVEIEPSEEE